MFKKVLLVLLIYSMGWASSNQQRAEPSHWKSRSGLEWINGILFREVAESDINPNNRIFNVPRGMARTDIRGDFKLSYDYSLSFYFRPRFLGTSSDTYYSDIEKPINKSEGKWDINETYLDYDITDFWAMSLGLQNFQWGPAESVSPSNAIFHFENNQKSVFYRAKGRVLARSNITLFGNHSLIVIHEPESNKEAYWIANKEFEKKTLVKWESRSANDSNTYIGLTYGTEDLERKFYGGYFNLFFLETYSFYSDFKVSDGSIAYYPMEVSPGQFLLNNDPERLNEKQYFAVFGFRKESRGDFRIEWIYNSAGYKKEEVSLLGRALSSDQVYYLLNLSQAAKPGLEMYSQNYVYLSYRLPNLGRKKQSTLFFRYLYSPLDESGNAEVNWESPLNNFWNYYIEMTATHGDRNSEFSLAEKSSFFIGAKFAL